MAKRVGGMRRKTRSKLKKNIRERGKIRLSRYFQTFKESERVYLSAEPAVHEGMYFPRFHNKVGTIKRKKGRCYEVEIKDGKKLKMLIVHPAHLKKCQA